MSDIGGTSDPEFYSQDLVSITVEAKLFNQLIPTSEKSKVVVKKMLTLNSHTL